MKKVMILMSMLAVLFASAAYAEDIEALKQAFKEGFLSRRISGYEIYRELHEKYSEKPFLYVQLLKNFEEMEKGPFFVLDFKTKVDDLGRLIIYPELKISSLKKSDFRQAFYLLSLLEYRKDFLDLEKIQKAIDLKYEELKLTSDNNNSSALRTIELE